MKKIYEIFGLNKTEGLIGIEVEAEGKGLGLLNDGVWRTENDGSLRGAFGDGSAEYVLAKPVPYKSVKKALDALNAHLAKAVKVDFSFRTSVHIHYNVQDFTEDQLLNMIYTYSLLESALVNFCGQTRINNRFCLRVRDAEGIIPILADGFTKGVQSFANVNPEAARYSALNICSLPRYGSLEFRSMEGTSDSKRIQTWIDAIHSLGMFAQEQKNVTSIYNLFIDLGPQKFFKEVLKKSASKFDYPGLVEEINLGFSLSIDLPHFYKLPKKKPEEIKVDAKKFLVDWNNVPELAPAPLMNPLLRGEALRMLDELAAADAPGVIEEVNGEEVLEEDDDFPEME